MTDSTGRGMTNEGRQTSNRYEEVKRDIRNCLQLKRRQTERCCGTAGRSGEGTRVEWGYKVVVLVRDEQTEKSSVIGI